VNNKDSNTPKQSFWVDHKLLLLLVIAISIVLTLTGISLSMYISSGASQLDLSRPGYQSVQDQVEKHEGIKEYSAVGQIDPGAIAEFKDLYNEQAEKARQADAFSGDPLNPTSLGIE
jgi:hypothetical protein